MTPSGRAFLVVRFKFVVAPVKLQSTSMPLSVP
jgi:hypothetical protein